MKAAICLLACSCTIQAPVCSKVSEITEVHRCYSTLVGKSSIASTECLVMTKGNLTPIKLRKPYAIPGNFVCTEYKEKQ